MDSVLRDGEVFLDVLEQEPRELVHGVLSRMCDAGALSADSRDAASASVAERMPWIDDLGHGVGAVRIVVPATELVRCALQRLPDGFVADDGAELHFLFVLVGASAGDTPPNSTLEPFGFMLVDEGYSADALGAQHPKDLLTLYTRYLDDLETPEAESFPAELERTKRLFGGLVADIKRRAPHYASDLREGVHPKALASILFLFFACLAPAIAFGGLLSVLTDGSIGAVEMLVATALCGTVYALASGQPLTILGSTGPVIVFTGILYGLTESLALPFLPTLAWVGIWTGVILAILAVTDASSFIRHFTRFTDETFAALIALIFIVEALKDTFRGFADPETPDDTALLSLVLALGTYTIATQLARFRRSPYLRRPVREFLADFGPTIAIFAMTVVALWFHPVHLEKLDVPLQFQTTAGRSWVVDPFEAPPWVWGASIVPALLVSVLLYLDQNITVRLVNAPGNRLRKGAGYHLDLLVVGALVVTCSLFGLPWMVAATVRSLNHVRSLATIEARGGQERIVRVRENRVTGLFVHLLVAASLLVLWLLKEVPMSVLFGLFLYMGVASMRGNQFFERLRLFAVDPAMLPPRHYVKRVPLRVVHAFTGVQAASLAVLWIVKMSVLGIVFPLFIALLVPVRFLLGRYFEKRHLAFLDADEEPDEEEDRGLT